MLLKKKKKTFGCTRQTTKGSLEPLAEKLEILVVRHPPHKPPLTQCGHLLEGASETALSDPLR